MVAVVKVVVMVAAAAAAATAMATRQSEPSAPRMRHLRARDVGMLTFERLPLVSHSPLCHTLSLSSCCPTRC